MDHTRGYINYFALRIMMLIITIITAEIFMVMISMIITMMFQDPDIASVISATLKQEVK